MAKYKSGEEVQVGDIAVCCSRFLLGAQFAGKYQVSEVCDFPSLSTAELICFHEFGKSTFAASMFDLVSRAPSQPKEQSMQEQPLVVWPEEEQELTFGDLKFSEWFVFRQWPQAPCLRLDGQDYLRHNEHGSWTKLNTINSYPVRRLQLTTPPQFTVV